MYIDSHAHLSDEAFCEDLDKVIGDFEHNGIDYVIEIGCDMPESINAVNLSKQYNNIYATVGLHPIVAETYTDEDLVKLEKLAKSDKVLAIGEIGLDYHYDYDRDKQKELFVEQLKIADRLGLPIVVHLRDAYGDMQVLLQENEQYINNGMLLHCYSGSKEMVKVFEKYDPYYAFGGAITFKNNNRAEVIRVIPMDRLMLETDCPYMSPVPLRGSRNNPNNIPIIAEKMGDALGISKEEVGRITSENTKRFFRFGDK